MTTVKDKTKLWKASYRIERFWAADYDQICREGLNPYDVSEFEDNIALNTGKAEIWALVLGTSSALFNATNTRVGVGDSTTAEAKTQTDLVAATNKTYKACESTWPTRATVTDTNDTFEARASFGSAEANYAWQEFVIKNNSSGISLNRRVSNQGTKASGQTWVITLRLQAG